jgi:hypothetical protein
MEIYLDNNATTAIAPEVREAMLPFLGLSLEIRRRPIQPAGPFVRRLRMRELRSPGSSVLMKRR